MTLHSGKTYCDGDVEITAPDPELAVRAAEDSDVQETVSHWLSLAQRLDSVHYFSILRQDQLVGHIFLHDIDQEHREALVGYHLLQAIFRGKGTGSRTLTLLQQFAGEATNLERLIIITSDDNLASQRIAQKCGFHYAGRS